MPQNPPLSPCPFPALVTRMFRELEARQRIFDLPAAAFVRADPRQDWTVRFHDRPSATPFGPAAGPQTQLAQNIVLSWLAGGRIIELKTVQANDRIEVARPCIDVRTVGFNVEWSQELTLEQALEEYVKASMLIQMLAASRRVPVGPGFDRFLFDASVGYDLASVSSARVVDFIRTLRDATPVIDHLRQEIPGPWREYADLPFDPCVASSVTVSTFHGCPAGEIEQLVTFLLRDLKVPVVVKLNPTLLGFDETRRLLHDALGYSNLGLSREAFDRDLQWDDMCGLVERLRRIAAVDGLGFGVKLTNTLVVENEGEFLPPSEPNKYLSGAPLHVLAMHLVARMRARFGTRVPLSFSGGIDRLNFADAVALGLTPITVCTDLLKTGGYARGQKYFRELRRRMEAAGAATIGEFIVSAYGLGATSHDEAVRLNTEHYVRHLETEPRYAAGRNSRAPRKIGRALRLFDCLACDKCVPVCPNDANFTFVLPPGDIPLETIWHDGERWRSHLDGVLPITAARQIGTFADLCNDCGNCDVFCPEDGGPFRTKPRFFGTAERWRRAAPRDGFYLDRTPAGDLMVGRLDGEEYRFFIHGGQVCYAGRGFAIEFTERDPVSTACGDAEGEIDLGPFRVMNALRQAVLAVRGSNFVNCL